MYFISLHLPVCLPRFPLPRPHASRRVRIPDEGGLEPIFRGLAAGTAQELDVFVIHDLRNFLFGPQRKEVLPSEELASPHPPYEAELMRVSKRQTADSPDPEDGLLAQRGGDGFGRGVDCIISHFSLFNGFNQQRQTHTLRTLIRQGCLISGVALDRTRGSPL